MFVFAGYGGGAVQDLLGVGRYDDVVLGVWFDGTGGDAGGLVGEENPGVVEQAFLNSDRVGKVIDGGYSDGDGSLVKLWLELVHRAELGDGEA